MAMFLKLLLNPTSFAEQKVGRQPKYLVMYVTYVSMVTCILYFTGSRLFAKQKDWHRLG